MVKKEETHADDSLNKGGAKRKRDEDNLTSRWAMDACVNPDVAPLSSMEVRDSTKPRGVTRRQVVETPGYSTTDDFGTDGE